MRKNINLQDTFLTKARRSGVFVTVYLMNGFQMHGTIAAFDSFTVILMTDGKQQIIYKHAISTISPLHPLDLESGADESEAEAEK